MIENFASIPILDLSQAASPSTRPRFLSDLQHALVKVGFFYLKGHRIPETVQKTFINRAIDFFDLPIEKKREVDMINSPHYNGYTGYTQEKTKDEPDYRETITFGVKELPAPTPDQPLYRNLVGPNQWPSESDIPGFRQAVDNYLDEVCRLMEEFKILIAEALGLEPTALLQFFDNYAGDRFKLIKYPPPPPVSDDDQDSTFSGIGPHKDGTFLTFLLQGTAHSGLEIQNKSGQWIAANPIPGTLVVNIGRSLESLTEGVCNATTHRVSLRPSNFVDEDGHPLGPRYSFPVFQVLRWDWPRKDFVVNIPSHIADPVRGEKIISDVQGQPREEFDRCLGHAVFKGYALKHPHVGEKFYPDVLAEARITRI